MTAKTTSRKYYILLVLSCFMPFIASVIYFFILDGHFFAKWAYLITKILIFLLPIFALGTAVKAFFKTLKFNTSDILLGLLSSAIIAILFFIFINTPLWQFITVGKDRITHKINSFNVGEYYLLFSLVISFIHSMLEEYYWRWFVFGNLSKFFKNRKPHILAALAFSLHHYVVCIYYFSILTAVMLTLVVFCGGLLFSKIYAKKGFIPGAWIAHVAADLCIFYAGYLILK